MMTISETDVEQRLKRKLEARGFKVLKLETPGYNGTPDRLILRSKRAPGPPYVVEIKAPGEVPRMLQYQVMIDWEQRGVLVLGYVSDYGEVDLLVERISIPNYSEFN
jgi:hypothetical protein